MAKRSRRGNEPETLPAHTRQVTLPTLDGFTVGITADRRWEEQAELLRRRGADIIHGPVIKTLPLGPDDGLLLATESVILSPPNILIANTGIGMRSWFAAAESWGLGEALIGALAEAAIFARGPKASGAVHQAGLPVAAQATSERLAEVCELVIATGIAGQRIAFQRHGDDAPDLIDALQVAGAEVEEVPVYNWKVPTDHAPALRLIKAAIGGDIHAMTFTSAPAVRNLALIADEHELLEPLLFALNGTIVVACVGPVCAAAASDLGIDKLVVPAKARLGPLILEMAEALVTRSSAYAVGGREVVLRGSTVTIDGRSLCLSTRERGVIQHLAARCGVVISKADLLRSIWGEASLDPHVVEVTVCRLRSHMGDIGDAITSVPRRGYMLDARALQ